MIKIDHTTLAKDPALGFYEIGGKVFWDKASALMEGTKMGLGYSDLHWNFNDEYFGKFNWTQEPPGTVKNYYHARAREIREKYDYIILNCSGGADSTTMLYSFIQQGLHVDEVFVRHAKAGTAGHEPDSTNMLASNEHSEFEYAAKPLLEWLKKVSPRTKITVHDFSLDVLNDNLTWDENFIHWCGDYVTPGCVVRYTHASLKDSLNLFDKGKRVGMLFGTDKPRFFIKDQQLYLRFMDRVVHSATPSAVNNGYDNTEVELFYWAPTPSATALVAKQCHMIRDWFNHPMNHRMRFMLDNNWLANPSNRTVFESMCKTIIYPDYDASTFQVNKPARSVYQEWDYWMGDFTNTQGYKTFMRGMMHLYKNIDASFLKFNNIGVQDSLKKKESALTWEYMMCSSPLYYIGDLTPVASVSLNN